MIGSVLLKCGVINFHTNIQGLKLVMTLESSFVLGIFQARNNRILHTQANHYSSLLKCAPAHAEADGFDNRSLNVVVACCGG